MNKDLDLQVRAFTLGPPYFIFRINSVGSSPMLTYIVGSSPQAKNKEVNILASVLNVFTSSEKI
jgi:hypothetical protein